MRMGPPTQEHRSSVRKDALLLVAVDCWTGSAGRFYWQGKITRGDCTLKHIKGTPVICFAVSAYRNSKIKKGYFNSILNYCSLFFQ